MKKVIFVLFSILILYTSLFAQQVPQKFSYQGVVRDESGNVLVNQDADFRFTISGDVLGQQIFYQETQAVTTNQFGLINVLIGNGTVVNGLFSLIPWGNAPIYFLIDLDIGSGFVSMGNQELVSVPYALYASSGLPGPTGPVGETGLPGSTGPMGIQGPSGFTGEIGPTGPTGITGQDGLSGGTGPTGPEGIQGNTGETGMNGLPGPTGVQGSTGPTGSTNSIMPIIRVYESDTVWVKPIDLKYVIVEVCGGGGGGGSCVWTSAGGGGGGGGGYAKKIISTDDLLSMETITIGLGGTGGSLGNNYPGLPGDTSFFGNHCSASGGEGGMAGAINNGTGALGGIGLGGDVNISGGGGGACSRSNADSQSGTGGNSMLGGGAPNAKGYAGGVNGVNGGQYGGGGSGGARLGTGGNGANGVVIITEYY